MQFIVSNKVKLQINKKIYKNKNRKKKEIIYNCLRKMI